MGWDIEASGVFYDAASGPVELIVPNGVRSGFYSYSGPKVLQVYRVEKKDDGTTVKRVVGTVDLGAAGDIPLLIFTPSKNGPPDAYNIASLADDLKALPAGCFRFVNTTRLPLDVKLGPERFTVRPQESRLSEAKPEQGRATLYATVVAKSAGGDVVVYGNNWAYDPANRALVFIREDTETPGRVSAKRLVESAFTLNATISPEGKQ